MERYFSTLVMIIVTYTLHARPSFQFLVRSPILSGTLRRHRDFPFVLTFSTTVPATIARLADALRSERWLCVRANLRLRPLLRVPVMQRLSSGIHKMGLLDMP
ncbi:hypothetical protein BKA93DRAFT_360822 [Sparassis latifolia]